MLRRSSIFCLVAILGTCQSVALGQYWNQASSQYLIYNPHYAAYAYEDSIASRIRAVAHNTSANAEYQRAIGEHAVNQAVAASIATEAQREQLWLPFERCKAYWDTRTLNRAQSEAFRHDPLKDAKRRNSREADRILNHSDGSPARIPTATTLNLMLGRLSSMNHGSSFHEMHFSSAVATHEKIPKEVLRCLKFARNSGHTVAFRAEDGMPLSLENLPFALREPALEDEISTLQSVRELVLSGSQTGYADFKSLADLMKAVVALETAIQSTSFRNPYLANTDGRRYTHYRQAVKFVSDLKAQVIRIQECGGILPYDGAEPPELLADGCSILELLEWMSCNGLEFRPAAFGCEYAYVHVHRKMIPLYACVANDDAGAIDDPHYLNPGFQD